MRSVGSEWVSLFILILLIIGASIFWIKLQVNNLSTLVFDLLLLPASVILLTNKHRVVNEAY